jgi:hypothetical protein
MVGFNAGPSMAPSAYHKVQIFQAAQTAAVPNEMVHDALIPSVSTGQERPRLARP